jgi:hypothetical protein
MLKPTDIKIGEYYSIDGIVVKVLNVVYVIEDDLYPSCKLEGVCYLQNTRVYLPLTLDHTVNITPLTKLQRELF